MRYKRYDPHRLILAHRQREIPILYYEMKANGVYMLICAIVKNLIVLYREVVSEVRHGYL